MTVRPLRAPNGKPKAFLEAALSSNTDNCVIWPYGLYPTGYAYIKENGKSNYGHRLVCTKAHGPCPEGHEVAHTCGIRACINPKHLCWKTPKGNIADRKVHGTEASGEKHGQAKLTWEIVRQIQEATGKESAKTLANKFGITSSMVYKIQKGKSWKV